MSSAVYTALIPNFDGVRLGKCSVTITVSSGVASTTHNISTGDSFVTMSTPFLEFAIDKSTTTTALSSGKWCDYTIAGYTSIMPD